MSSKTLNVFRRLLEIREEGIRSRGYPISFERLQKLNPEAYAELPDEDGKLYAWDNWYMFVPHGAPPLIWGPIEPHKKPVMNDDGEVAFARNVSRQPPGWYYYKQFSPAQKRHLGWFPTRDRGPARGLKGKKQHVQPASRLGIRVKGAGGWDPGVEKPFGASAKPATKSGMAAVKRADAAKKMDEPDWDAMSKQELEKSLTFAMRRAKEDPQYVNTVHNIINAFEKKGMSEGAYRLLKSLIQEVKDDPCWKGYEMVGTKKKGGKKVPNCVPKNEADIDEEDDLNEKQRTKKKWKGYASVKTEGGEVDRGPWSLKAKLSDEDEDEILLGEKEGQCLEVFEISEEEHGMLDEAEYQGRKVKLNKVMRGDKKKNKVYVKNPKGNVVKVEFGDPNMRRKPNDPDARKSFRARHNCDNPGPKHKARYWSCRMW